MDTADDPLIGRVLGDKYRIEGVIGRGGFGAVYRAVQQPVGREVAVKVIRHDDPRTRTRFFREAKVLSRLSDPAIVTLHDYGEEPDGLLYMVQELIEGRPLSIVLAGGRRFDTSRAVRIAIQILHALEDAHTQQVVHRDIKPDNVMLTRGRGGAEEVRVLDFGIVKMLADDDGYETTRGQTVGTPPYMSPEQTRGKGIGPATDLYALGILLHRMLLGRVPFLGDSNFETMMMHRKAPLPPLDGLDAPLAAVVQRALQKKVADRYPDAATMRIALEALAVNGGLGSTLPPRAAADDGPTIPTPSPVEMGDSLVTPYERPRPERTEPAGRAKGGSPWLGAIAIVIAAAIGAVVALWLL